MKTKLAEIVANTRAEVAQRKRIISEALLYTKLPTELVSRSFYDALGAQKSSVALIAEIKHASPSNGSFHTSVPSKERVLLYEKAGADAISYVSDAKYFGGSLPELQRICKTAIIPVLQKDFIIDMYQLVEAAIHRVDAVLLIARVLTTPDLRSFVTFAHLNGSEPLVEVYNEDDLEKALQTDTRVIGVNARNLDTFQIDRENACRLITMVPPQILTIAFSGIETKEHVQKYKQAGAQAVLVGSALMNSANIPETITNLKS